MIYEIRVSVPVILYKRRSKPITHDGDMMFERY